MRKKRKVSYVCWLLLAVLQISTPSSAQDTPTTVSTVSLTTRSTPKPASLSYQTRPQSVSVAVGESAVFTCGVPGASPNLTFNFYGSHGNYLLTCPHGHVEDIPQGLYGSCEMKNGESLAVWTLKGTSLPDNNTKVICQQLGNHEATAAVLHVYDNGGSYATLIGCLIGGFFGIMLVFALLYLTLQRSERLRQALCLVGDDTEDDLDTIVTKD